MATVEGPSTKKQKPNMSFSDQMRVRQETKRRNSVLFFRHNEETSSTCIPPHPPFQVYYKSLFPFGDFFRWISYGKDRTDHPEHDPTFTKRREICFTLEGDIFVRCVLASSIAT